MSDYLRPFGRVTRTKPPSFLFAAHLSTLAVHEREGGGIERGGGELFEWCQGLRDKPKALRGNTAFRTEDSTKVAETSEKRAYLTLSNASPTARLEMV